MENEIIYSNKTLIITKEKLRRNEVEFIISEILQLWTDRSSYLPMIIFISLKLSIILSIILSAFYIFGPIIFLSFGFPLAVLFFIFLTSALLYFFYASLSDINRSYTLIARISNESIQIIESNDLKEVMLVKHIIETQNPKLIK